jgi:hypothetical protein
MHHPSRLSNARIGSAMPESGSEAGLIDLASYTVEIGFPTIRAEVMTQGCNG